MSEVPREQGSPASVDDAQTGPEPETVPADSGPSVTDPTPADEPSQTDEPAKDAEAEADDTEAWIRQQLAGSAPVADSEKAESAKDSEPAEVAELAEVTEPAGTTEPAAVTEPTGGDSEALPQTDATDGEDPEPAENPEAEDIGEGETEPAEEGEPEAVEEIDAIPTYQRFDLTSGDPAVLAEAAEAARIAIENGECIVLPTDTVYGIGADAFETDAVQRLLDAKDRGRDMPPPVLIGDPALIRALAENVPEQAGQLTEKHWPGPLTVIVKARESLRIDLGETNGTIGLRVPDYEITRELLRQTGPMAVSSANLSGKPAALTCDEAIEYFGNKVSVYLDGGPLSVYDGAPSSMVDFSQNDHGELLRHGALSLEVLRETCPDLVDFTADPEPVEPEPEEPEDSTASADENAAEPTEPEDTEPDSSEEVERLIEQSAESDSTSAEPDSARDDGSPTQT